MNVFDRAASAATLAVVTILFAAGVAAAENLPEVTVQVPRVVKADPGRPGSPYDIILKGHVSYSDLDLSKPADAATLEQRVTDKARAICERIDKDYPESTPRTADCAKSAAADAMLQVKKAIAAAAKH